MLKHVWSYWEGPLTPLVEMCISSWRKHLAPSGWTVHVLTPETLNQYEIIKPKSFESLTPTTKSDVIRLSLLYTHGGLWLDASVYLTSNVDWLLNQSSSICGVRLGHHQYIESWILYSLPHNRHVFSWLETFNDILDTSPVTKHRAYESPCVDRKEYFMIYQAFCFLRQEHVDFEKIFHACKHVTGLDVFSFGFVPLQNEHFLVKFTKNGRNLYPFLKFPLIYVYIFVFIIFVSACVLLGRGEPMAGAVPNQSQHLAGHT